MAYTNEEYYDMLMALGECHGQYHVAARRYTELYPNRARHPSAAVILRAAQRLYETGSVLLNKQDTGRHRDARNVRNTEQVLRAFENNPESSIRVIAREHNLSYATIQRILKEENLHPFHYTRVQHLRAEDYRTRRTFCENFLRKVDQNPRFPSYVIFSDESLFTQEGISNPHNMHIWSEENPSHTTEKFPNSLENQSVGWNNGNSNTWSSCSSRYFNWPNICGLFKRESAKILRRSSIIREKQDCFSTRRCWATQRQNFFMGIL